MPSSSSPMPNEAHEEPGHILPAGKIESLEACIAQRHSVRFYKPDPVPMDLLYSCLSLARFAPSNSNIQNWRLTFATGAARERIVAAMSAARAAGEPVGIKPLPDDFKHYRSEMGHKLYGEHGYAIPRGEKERLAAATGRNFRFFDAPVAGVVHMARGLTSADSMSVGMYAQTLMLALTEHGLGACLVVSVVGFEPVLRREFGLDDDQEIICGIAIGWPDEDQPVNKLKMSRDEVDKAVTFLTE